MTFVVLRRVRNRLHIIIIIMRRLELDFWFDVTLSRWWP